MMFIRPANNIHVNGCFGVIGKALEELRRQLDIERTHFWSDKLGIEKQTWATRKIDDYTR